MRHRRAASELTVGNILEVIDIQPASSRAAVLDESREEGLAMAEAHLRTRSMPIDEILNPARLDSTGLDSCRTEPNRTYDTRETQMSYTLVRV